MLSLFLCLIVLFHYIDCKVVWNVLHYGIVPTNKNIDTCNSNTKIIQQLINNELKPGDTLLIPTDNDFWFNGGIYVSASNITIQLDGSIHYQNNRDDWPTQYNSTRVLEAMRFDHSDHITFTSSHHTTKGLINGNGKAWWGAINYCAYKENRPRLLHFYNSSNLLIEYIYFKDSPYWTVDLEDVRNVEIHHSNVSAKQNNKDYHDLFDITAFNTDGFDISGENVWIHDVEIWNDDDCIAVKTQSASSYQSNCSRNMLFERINASGVGLTVGSIGPTHGGNNSCVNNITFRDVFMFHTWKGIYLKSAPGKSGQGMISNILYENITMQRPTGVPIWIGPQQAIYHDQCSLLWPAPFTKCPVTSHMTWLNITLRNIRIIDPKESPGVILGNKTNPMQNIVFDNVTVQNPGTKPWGSKFYKCEGVKNFVAMHGTKPVPPCGSENDEMNDTLYGVTSLSSIPGYSEWKELMDCVGQTVD